MQRSFLVVTVPVALAALAGIVALGTAMARVTGRSIIARLPVARTQIVELPGEGNFTLSIEGRLGESGLQNLRYSLVDAQSGASISLQPVLMHTHFTNMDGRLRQQLLSFHVAHGGGHRLTVAGDEGRDWSRNAILVNRAIAGEIFPRLLALIFCAALFIGSIVLSAIMYARTRA